MKRTDQVIFVSACFIVFDTQKGTARCASAGHPSPLLGNRRTGEIRPVYKDLKKNPALGLLPQASYQVFDHELREHDIFLLFTDGVEEAMNAQDEYYGMERLQRAMSDNLKLDIGDLTEAIVDDILKFSGDQPLADDLCLVAAEALLNKPWRALASDFARGIQAYGILIARLMVVDRGMLRDGKEAEGFSDSGRAVDATMAVFLDLENIALGAKTAVSCLQYQACSRAPAAARGQIVVKKAYCDFDRYKEFKKTFMKPRSSSSKFLTSGIRARIPRTSGWWLTPWTFATRNSIWTPL